MTVIAQVIIAVQGRVQGVDYHTVCVQHARLLGLRGQIHNRRDDVVEASLVDLETSMLSVRGWMWGGPGSAQVTQLDVITDDHEAPVPGSEIRPTV